MSFERSADLHPDLTPIAWMIGRWEGSGKATYPGTEDFDFGQQIDFAHNGGNYLHYLSQMFEVDDHGLPIKPLGMETGFWRPQPDSSLEVVMSRRRVCRGVVRSDQRSEDRVGHRRGGAYRIG